MALSGLQIYKLLPKTNCKECGFPTCLAFAMKLAAKQVELDACPYVSDEAKESLSAASAPPIRLIKVGTGDQGFQVGNETVMFRHEKTFFNQPGLALRVKDTEDADTIEEKVETVNAYCVERVGIDMTFNAIAIENASGDAGAFAGVVAAVRAKTKLPFVLISDSADALKAALQKEGGQKPLLYAATTENWEVMAALTKESGASLVVRSNDGLDELADLTSKIADAGVADLVLDPGSRDLGTSLAQVTQLRRLALKKNFRPFGFPAMVDATYDDFAKEAVVASMFVEKYAGIIIINGYTFFLGITGYQHISRLIRTYPNPDEV